MTIRNKILYFAIPTTITIYGTHLGLNNLEKKYPNQPLSTGSQALKTPSQSSQHSPYTDIYAARIPVKTLSQPGKSLQEAWARTLLNSSVLRTEASLFGLFKNGKYAPGDLGNGAGFAQEGHELMNGIMVVQRGIDADSNGLLVSWKMADEPRIFFEKIAAWGYQWRLMSGGRHEMSVSEPFEVPGAGEFVDVRFGSTHDYEVIIQEGGLSEQKILPEWVNRLHRGFARLILDVAVRELQRD